MLSRSRLDYQVLLTSLRVLTFGITSCNRAEEKKNEVSVDGGTVGFLIHQAVVEEFQKAKPNAQVSVASSGTGGVKNIYTPLSRPLFIYVSKKSLNTEAAVKEFVNFYLDNSWEWVDQFGYVALPDEPYPKIKQKLAY